MSKCADCSAPMDLDEVADSLLKHEMVLCESCLADRRKEDKSDLELKDL